MLPLYGKGNKKVPGKSKKPPGKGGLPGREFEIEGGIKMKRIVVVIFAVAMMVAVTRPMFGQRQWTPTNRAVIDEKKFFSSLDVCVAAPDVVYYVPSDFTRLASWEVRYNKGEVEKRRLESDECMQTPTSEGLQNVVMEVGSWAFYDKQTGEMLARGDCGNVVLKHKPRPKQTPPPRQPVVEIPHQPPQPDTPARIPIPRTTWRCTDCYNDKSVHNTTQVVVVTEKGGGCGKKCKGVLAVLGIAGGAVVGVVVTRGGNEQKTNTVTVHK